MLPFQSCSEWGLHGIPRYRGIGGLLPRLSILTALPCGNTAVYFCCTFLEVAFTGCYPAPCPAAPGPPPRSPPCSAGARAGGARGPGGARHPVLRSSDFPRGQMPARSLVLLNNSIIMQTQCCVKNKMSFYPSKAFLWYQYL